MEGWPNVGDKATLHADVIKISFSRNRDTSTYIEITYKETVTGQEFALTYNQQPLEGLTAQEWIYKG